MKKLFKWLGISIGSLLAITISLGLHEWYAEKPFFFRVFLDRTMLEQALDSPETLTSLGFLDAIGIKGHNAELDDDSPEKADEFFNSLENLEATLNSYADEDLDESQRLSKRIAQYLIDTGKSFRPYRYYNYPVNQLFGVQNGFPSFMDSQHQVETLEDAENYLARLNKVKTKFAQNLEGLQIRKENGIVPPDFVIERVLDGMNSFVAQPVEENILYTSLKKKLEAASDEITEAERDDILQQAAVAIKDSVHPAYKLFINHFESLADGAPTDDGYWRFENGDEAYKARLKFYTTTSYTPKEIHEIGLAEIDRIQAEMIQILEQEGYDSSNGFTELMAQLSSQEKFYYPDTDEGREQILADYQKILDEIDEGINDVFNIRPKTGMEVMRVPEFREKTAPGAYYQRPSLDGSRPGKFFANLYDIKATPKYGMRTLAYHEGIPGHHFQISISMELEGLPIFRTMSSFTTYTEGWALYAEQLAWEMGFQDDPYDNIGRLQAELFRAVRLVVDTGLHYDRWTREEAIEYMLANTGMAESDVVSEIERYIVMPGQATSYKIGMMKILELRQRAKDELGNDFNLAEFHDVVLKNGAVPMDILDELVTDYIKSKKPAKKAA
ncbi:MAG: DUF885 domain-containing protein [Gammaproteobacteria bacterium]|nr:DUF885 domain-containing protein [Gammaproteobacteria bacterium]NNJ73141.1 DUF885 domain-containing protein [Enterobacterales bacterium]